MLFLDLLFGVIALIFLIFFVTQVVTPLVLSTPLFPLFRKATPLRVKVEEAETELAEKTELVRLQKRLFEVQQAQAVLQKEVDAAAAAVSKQTK
jgi:hypothetical protein